MISGCQIKKHAEVKMEENLVVMMTIVDILRHLLE